MAEYDAPSEGLAKRIAARRKRLQLEAGMEGEPMVREASEGMPMEEEGGPGRR